MEEYQAIGIPDRRDDPCGQNGRFGIDFKVIEILYESLDGGRKVMKVQHKIDECEYAVKEIKFPMKNNFVYTNLDGSTNILRDGNNILNLHLREVTALANLQHENVLRYHSAWLELNMADTTSSVILKNEDSVPGENLILILYIQTELCTCNLRKRLLDRRVNNININEMYGDVISIFKQIFEGVAYFHRMGYVHRDLKLENIFWNGPNSPIKIGDFGLSKYLGIGNTEQANYADSSALKNSKGIGTWQCVAPELWEGESEYSFEVDNYSIGVMFYEMLSPWRVSDSEWNLLYAESKCPQDFKNKFKRAARVIERLIDRDPRKRPSAFKVLSDKLFSRLEETSIHIDTDEGMEAAWSLGVRTKQKLHQETETTSLGTASVDEQTAREEIEAFGTLRKKPNLSLQQDTKVYEEIVESFTDMHINSVNTNSSRVNVREDVTNVTHCMSPFPEMKTTPGNAGSGDELMIKKEVCDAMNAKPKVPPLQQFQMTENTGSEQVLGIGKSYGACGTGNANFNTPPQKKMKMASEIAVPGNGAVVKMKAKASAALSIKPNNPLLQAIKMTPGNAGSGDELMIKKEVCDAMNAKPKVPPLQQFQISTLNSGGDDTPPETREGEVAGATAVVKSSHLSELHVAWKKF